MIQSIFLKTQGDSPKNRILDFLIVHQEFDYSLKDIAKYSGAGYATLKKMQKDLIANGWIILTRKVGKAKMYKLNLKSPVVNAFIDFYWSVVLSEVKNKENRKKPSYADTTANLSLPVRNM